MGCTHPDVPTYLHYDVSKKIYPNWRFAFWHYIFRTGYRARPNPIETDKMRSGYSVCWSKLINHHDVLKTVLAANPNLGDAVYLGSVKDVKKIKVETECTDGDYQGKHIVKPLLVHSPEECNYSHAEILILHSYNEQGKFITKTIKYKDWESSIFANGKPKPFFKKLRNDYRAKILTVLNNELDTNQLPFTLRFHPRKALVRFLIYIRFR